MGLKNNIAKGSEKLGSVPVIGGLFKSRPKVAVIRLSGVIADQGMRRQSSISHARYYDILERAFETHKLQAVALCINSPGGSPAQSSLIGNTIRRLSAEKSVPVYAFVEDIAASGGYWLACAADEIYAQESSIIGSIGVISASFGLKDLIERYGVERRVHTSGKDKSFLDPFQDEKPADVKRLKALQKDIHEQFKDWVREHRAERLKGPEKDIFEGQFWTAATAYDYGLIDGMGDVYDVCQEKFGEDIKFIDFGPDKGLLSGLLHSRMGQSSLAHDIVQILEEKEAKSRFGV